MANMHAPDCDSQSPRGGPCDCPITAGPVDSTDTFSSHNFERLRQTEDPRLTEAKALAATMIADATTAFDMPKETQVVYAAQYYTAAGWTITPWELRSLPNSQDWIDLALKLQYAERELMRSTQSRHATREHPHFRRPATN